jgi:OOP family OmpA-OmpF porin/outer membrane immunogenic protein
MKNTMFALALCAAGLTAVPAASQAAQDNGGFFVNGGVGGSSLNKGAYDDTDTGYDINIGYRWALNPNVALGIEGGYTDLGSFGPKSTFAGLPKAKVSGWTLGVNGHFNLTPNWYVAARGGFFRGDIKGVSVSGLPVYVDDTSNKYYFGAGFGYDFSNNFSIGLDYDYYKADKNGLKANPDLISVNAEYRFGD